MKKETIDFAKKDLIEAIIKTNEARFINKMWKLINQQEICEFWDNEAEVNTRNVKLRVIENISYLSEDDVENLQYLFLLYKLTKARLIENAASSDQELSCI